MVLDDLHALVEHIEDEHLSRPLSIGDWSALSARGRFAVRSVMPFPRVQLLEEIPADSGTLSHIPCSSFSERQDCNARAGPDRRRMDGSESPLMESRVTESGKSFEGKNPNLARLAMSDMESISYVEACNTRS